MKLSKTVSGKIFITGSASSSSAYLHWMNEQTIFRCSLKNSFRISRKNTVLKRKRSPPGRWMPWSSTTGREIYGSWEMWWNASSSWAEMRSLPGTWKNTCKRGSDPRFGSGIFNGSLFLAVSRASVLAASRQESWQQDESNNLFHLAWALVINKNIILYIRKQTWPRNWPF